MAKRGTLTHRRTRRLASALGISPPHALGLMEALWHVTAENAPRGDIGRLANQDLADEIYWDGEADVLIAAFVRAGVLEESEDYRLAVHGWSEHADNATRHKLTRARTTFWDGQPPFKARPLKSSDGETTTEHGQSPTDHEQPPEEHGAPWSDEIDPIQCPATSDQHPASSDQRPATSRTTDTPPSPPAGAGGRSARPLTVGSMHPATGGQVLAVAAGVPIVARVDPARLRRDRAATLEELVARAASLGLPTDRAARRQIGEQLKAFVRPAEIRAQQDRQAAELRESARALTPEELAEAARRKADGLARLAAGRTAAEPPQLPAATAPPVVEVEPDLEAEESLALRLVGGLGSPTAATSRPPAPPAPMPSSTVHIVHRGEA